MKSAVVPLARLCVSLLLFGMAVGVSGDDTRLVSGTTRAGRLGAMAVGMGSMMHMTDYLKTYKSSRTAIYCYFKMDDPRAGDLVRHLDDQARIQQRMGRDFWPQIALETKNLSLAAFIAELARQGTVTHENVRMLARTIASLHSGRQPVFIRPFSEMNDGTDFAPWEFANKRFHNTPEQLATAWKLLHDTFESEGATNAIFIFSPLAAYGVHHEPETKKALNLIPEGYIDAFGLNVYSRPLTAYGGTKTQPVPFAELATPWLKLLAETRHRGIPLAVSEMAVSNQATDADRAEWLRNAFHFTRAHGYVLVTYFNYNHRYWTIRPNTYAFATLNREMNLTTDLPGLPIRDREPIAVVPRKPFRTPAVAPPVRINPADIAIGDFENGRYDGWTMVGNCWGFQPASGATFRGAVKGFTGKRYLCSFHPKLAGAATGTATSREFTIQNRYINFLVGGGQIPGEVCVNLTVEGRVLKSQTGNDRRTLEPVSWDVGSLFGKRARIEILDRSAVPGLGYIMVDDIVLSSRPRVGAQ
jgi:hypothetical protein